MNSNTIRQEAIMFNIGFTLAITTKIKVLVNEETNAQLISLFGIPIKSGMTTNIDFTTIERDINHRLNTFFKRIKGSILVEPTESILQIQDGKLIDVPLSSLLPTQFSPLKNISKPQDPFSLEPGDYEVLEE